MTLDDLTARLKDAYGATLRAVVLYGDAVDAGPAAGTPAPAHERGQHLLVIVDTLPVEALERAAAVMRDWVAAGHSAPLTLTMAEWRSSSDVFAMEYADVLERHQLLHGALPMDGITVRAADIRRELEEQLLGKLLKLRRGIMEAGGDGGRETRLLEVSLDTFLALFRGVLRLHGERAPRDGAAVCERTGALAGFDTAPFTRVVRHVRGERVLQPGETRATLSGYLAGLERLIAHLDQYAPGA